MTYQYDDLRVVKYDVTSVESSKEKPEDLREEISKSDKVWGEIYVSSLSFFFNTTHIFRPLNNANTILLDKGTFSQIFNSIDR